MSNRIAFQTQLASIMEVLANAAVAEICKLVDDDYAIVNLQMSQCQRENKALKRKLHLLELKMARGLAERRIGSLGRANRVHVSAEKYRNQTNEVLYGAQLWRGGGTNVTPAHIMKENDSLGGDAAVSETDTVLIKEEIFEEEQTQDRLFSRNDEVTEIVSQTGEAGFGDVQMVNDEEQVSGMQTLELREMADEEPDTIVIKDEDPEDEWEVGKTQGAIIVQDESDPAICSRRLSTSPAKSTVALATEELTDLNFSHLRENRQDWSQRSNISPSTGLQNNTQGAVETNPSGFWQNNNNSAVQPSKVLEGKTAAFAYSGHTHKERVKSSISAPNQSINHRAKENSTSTIHPSCSYTTESDQDQDCILVNQDTVSLVRSSKTALEGASSIQIHEVRGSCTAEGPIREELGWNQAGLLRQDQTEPSGHCSSSEGIRTETSGRTNPSYFTVTSQMVSSLSQPGASHSGLYLPKRLEKGNRKCYVCKYCGKAFPGLSNVIAHQRVHTGERPYKCDTCGKLFTEAGNLKKHQRVHTGEKPYMCNRCGKRFAWICNLKTHQQSASCGGI